VRELLIVSCTRGRKEDTDLYRSYRSLRRLGTNRIRFIENNRKGLSACYNAILEERAGRDEIIIFVHDDVIISDIFLREKMTEACDKRGYAIVGLAGSSAFRIDPSLEVTEWAVPPSEAWSGWVEHDVPGISPIMVIFGPVPRRCIVLDGLFLAVDIKKAPHIRFDEQFAFHFYDLDFCLTANEAGLMLGTSNIYVTHMSHGNYWSQEFKDAQARFRAKWLPRQPKGGPVGDANNGSPIG
jgi:GT2 family glycosyltransferase